MSTSLHFFIKCDSFVDPTNACMSRLAPVFPYTVNNGEYAVFFMPYSLHDLRWPSRLMHYEEYGNVTAKEVFNWEKFDLRHLQSLPNWEEMVNWEGILHVFNEFCEFWIMLDQTANLGFRPLIAFFDENLYKPRTAREAREFLEEFVARQPVCIPFQEFMHKPTPDVITQNDDYVQEMETTYCLLPDPPEKRSRYSRDYPA